jgi:hypothetical protein
MPRQTYVPQPNGCTKEEFGVNLYDTVVTIGGILGIQDQIAGVIHREEKQKLPDLKAKRDTLRAALSQQVTALSPADMGELLQRFPIVPTL